MYKRPTTEVQHILTTAQPPTQKSVGSFPPGKLLSTNLFLRIKFWRDFAQPNCRFCLHNTARGRKCDERLNRLRRLEPVFPIRKASTSPCLSLHVSIYRPHSHKPTTVTHRKDSIFQCPPRQALGTRRTLLFPAGDNNQRRIPQLQIMSRTRHNFFTLQVSVKIICTWVKITAPVYR